MGAIPHGHGAMADEQDVERNYPATPRRLEQARERGQVARSRELTTAAVALAAAIGLSTVGATAFGQLLKLFRQGLTLDRAAAFDPALITANLAGLALDAGIALTPLLGLLL